MRGPDHRLRSGAGLLAAAGQEPVGCVGNDVDRVTRLLRGDPVCGRQRPGSSVRAGPDGVRARRQPSARAACDPHGRIPKRGLESMAAWQLNRGQLPGASGVRRDEELLADKAIGGLRARRHHRVSRGDNALDRLEDAARQLTGVGGQSGRGDRLQRPLASLERRGRFGLRAVAHQQHDGGDATGRDRQGRHAYRLGAETDPAFSGPWRSATRRPGAWRCGFEQEGAPRAVRLVRLVRARLAGMRPGLLPGLRQDRLSG